MSLDVRNKTYGECYFETNVKVSFKKHLPAVVYISRTLYCYQFSADFTYFVSLARELLLQSRLTFRENGPIVHNPSRISVIRRLTGDKNILYQRSLHNFSILVVLL